MTLSNRQLNDYTILTGRSMRLIKMMRIKHKHKFNCKPVTDSGIYFPSKLEHSYYQHLNLLKKTGDVLFFLRQVPFDLKSDNIKICKYIVDFQVFWKNGDITFVDVKGLETKLFLIKKKLVESQYPIEITIVKKGEF